MAKLAKYALDISEFTGLTLVPVNDRPTEAHEYWVLSPTGVKLFRVGSYGNGSTIGMVSTPNMYSLGSNPRKQKQS